MLGCELCWGWCWAVSKARGELQGGSVFTLPCKRSRCWKTVAVLICVICVFQFYVVDGAIILLFYPLKRLVDANV